MEPIKIGSTVPAEKVHYIIEKFPLKKRKLTLTMKTTMINIFIHFL